MAGVTFAPEQLATGAQRADGNGVDSEAEAAKLAENGLELNALTQVANSRVQIMKTAMGLGELMGLFDALNISASGLTAQRLRMDVTSANLANAETTRTPEGGAYRRQDVILQESSGSDTFAGSLAGAMGSGEAPAGVEVAAIIHDTTPTKKVYEPSNPEADGQGYVEMPNVNPVSEMTDLIDASRSYQANVTAMQTTKQVFSKTIELLSNSPIRSLPISPISCQATQWAVPKRAAASGRSARSAAPEKPARGRAADPAGGFGGMLTNAIGDLQKTQEAASTQATALATGQTQDLSSVITAVQEAQLSMELATQVRSKAVEAYTEIFHTQI